MKNTTILFAFCLLSTLSNAQQYFTFGPSFTYSRSEWFFQASPTNTDGNRQPVGWIKGIQSSPGTPLWSAFHMNTDTIRFGKFSGVGNSILGINSIGGIYRAPAYSFIDTNFLATRFWSSLNFQSKLLGTTAQYVRGNGTMATMPTDNTAFTNGSGYINVEADPVYSASSWFGTTNNSINWNTAYSNRISTFSTTGNSGTATFTGNTLNIPSYTLSGLGGQSQLNGTGFVKVTGTIVSYDNSSYPTTSDLASGLSAKENVITAGTTSQYWRGDKTFQTLDKTTIGLSNVDNTSDANKPVSTATNTALSGKQATLVSATNIRTINGASLLGSGDLTISTGEVNTASNVGSGSGVFKQKSGVDLQFKSLLGTSNQINVTNNTNDITLSLPTRIMSSTTRSLVTTTASTGYQISSTRDYSVNYSVYAQVSSALAGANTADVFLEIATTNSTTPSDWTTISRSGISLAGVLSTSGNTQTVGGFIPAGYYVRIRVLPTGANSGSAVFTYQVGQENTY